MKINKMSLFVQVLHVIMCIVKSVTILQDAGPSRKVRLFCLDLLFRRCPGKPGHKFLLQVIVMEKIEFTQSIDCRVCVLEKRDAPRRKLERIIQERRKCRKCKGCERLRELESNQ